MGLDPAPSRLGIGCQLVPHLSRQQQGVPIGRHRGRLGRSLAFVRVRGGRMTCLAICLLGCSLLTSQTAGAFAANKEPALAHVSCARL